MSASSFQKDLAASYGPTDSSPLNAPLQHPLQEDELPPELFLEREPSRHHPRPPRGSSRRKSMDQPFSIIGFMQRRIGEKRARLYSDGYGEKGWYE